MKKRLIAGLMLALSAAVCAEGTNIVKTAHQAGQFKTLEKALTEAGLVNVLEGNGPFTVFAPTDEAFAKLPPGTLESLLKDKAKLKAVLTYHVVPGKHLAAEVVKGQPLKTVQGQDLSVHVEGGHAKIEEAEIVKTDIQCSNGVIHVLDHVLVPK